MRTSHQKSLTREELDNKTPPRPDHLSVIQATMHPKSATMNPQSAIAQSIQSEAQAFAIAYVENWDTPDASSLEHYTTVASKAGRYYAPGCVLAIQ
jgi:hypothetical protein